MKIHEAEPDLIVRPSVTSWIVLVEAERKHETKLRHSGKPGCVPQPALCCRFAKIFLRRPASAARLSALRQRAKHSPERLKMNRSIFQAIAICKEDV